MFNRKLSVLCLVIVLCVALSACVSVTKTSSETSSTTTTDANGVSTTTTTTTTTENGQTETVTSTVHENIPFKMINSTDTNFYGLYCSSATSDKWGSDLLNGQEWTAGNSLNSTFTFYDEDPIFDFQVIDKDKTEYSFKGLNLGLSKLDEIVISITGTIAEGFTMNIESMK